MTDALPRFEDSSERFRLLVESVRDYAIFTLDPAGHVTSWNAGAQRFKQYRAEEIIGRHFSVLELGLYWLVYNQPPPPQH